MASVTPDLRLVIEDIKFAVCLCRSVYLGRISCEWIWLKFCRGTEVWPGHCGSHFGGDCPRGLARGGGAENVVFSKVDSASLWQRLFSKTAYQTVCFRDRRPAVSFERRSTNVAFTWSALRVLVDGAKIVRRGSCCISLAL